jgi:glycogen(starch) synthase
MKIAYVSYEYPPDTSYGGIATYVQQAAKLMAARGHGVEVFAASRHRCGAFMDGPIKVSLVQETTREQFPAEIAPLFGERHAQEAFDVVECPENNAEGRFILSTHPEVAHVVKLHTPHELLDEIMAERPNLAGWRRHYLGQMGILFGALRRGKRPTGLRTYRPGERSHEKLYAAERSYARDADLVVSSSLALERWALANWGLDKSRVITVPNPYFPTPAMLEISIGGEGQTVAFLGRLEQRKGIQDLVDAIPMVLREVPSARFRIVGKPVFSRAHGEMFDQYIRGRLARYSDAVTLVKPCPLEELPAEYAVADICVFPSIWENFANICLEAMAAGRAIVASSAGGMAEMLEGGKHGLLVPPRNPRAIAESVVRLLCSPQERLRLGASARRRLLEAYGSDVVATQLEQSYRQAIELKRK